MEKTIGIKPYQGKESYIFVSYAHLDRDRIEPALRRMIGAGYRVWYDEGIAPGTEWDNNIADHITKCSCLLAFISRNFLDSENCRDELNFARDLQKGRLLVYLEDVKLPLGMAMRLNRIQSIAQYLYGNSEDFYEKLFSTPMLDNCRTKLPTPAGPGEKSGPAVKVVGIGGGGSNTVSRLMEKHVPGVEYVAVNTDVQSLPLAKADKKLLIHMGQDTERKPDSILNACQEAARRQHDEIVRLLQGADIVFLSCGMGGITGTGMICAIAQIARGLGILTVGVVSMPFGFEGRSRMSIAEAGLARLKESADTVVALYNDKLLSLASGMTMTEAFRLSDDTLGLGIQGIADLIISPGIVRLTFDDLRRAMQDRGLAYIGVGAGTGPARMADAARQAVSNPLLDTRLADAEAVLVNVTGPADLSVTEVNEATREVTNAVGAEAGVFLGTAVDESLKDGARVVIIANGLA